MNEKITKLVEYAVYLALVAVILITPLIFSFWEIRFSVFELVKKTWFFSLMILGWLAYGILILRRGRIFFKVDKKLFLFLLLLFSAWAMATIFSVQPDLSWWGRYDREQGLLSLIFYLSFFVLVFLNLKEKKLKIFLWPAVISSFIVAVFGWLQFLNLDPFPWTQPAWRTGRIFSTLGQPNFLGHFLIITIPLAVYAAFFLVKKNIWRCLVWLGIIVQIMVLFFTYSRSAWLGLLAGLWFFSLAAAFFYKKRKILAVIFFLPIILLSSIIFLRPNYLANENFAVSRLISSFDWRGLAGGSVGARLNYWQAGLKEFRETNWKRKIFGYGPETLQDIFARQYQPDWAIAEAAYSFPDRAHNIFLDILLQFGLLGFLASLIFWFYVFYLAFWYLKNNQRDANFWLLLAALTSLVCYFVNDLFSFPVLETEIYFYLILAIVIFIVGKDWPVREKNIHLPLSFQVGVIFSALLFAAVFLYYYDWKFFRADHYYSAGLYQANNCPLALANFGQAINLNPFLFQYRRDYLIRLVDCWEADGNDSDRQEIEASLEWFLARGGQNVPDFYFKINAMTADDYLYLRSKDIGYRQKSMAIATDLLTNYPNFLTYNALARLYQRDDDLPAAEKMLDLAFQSSLNPTDSRLTFHRGEVLASLNFAYNSGILIAAKEKDYAREIYYYQKMLRLDPLNLPMYKRIADVYYQKNDLDTALWYNKRGYELGPRDSVWPASIALLYEQKGDKVAAERYAEESLALDAKNQTAIDLLKRLK